MYIFWYSMCVCVQNVVCCCGNVNSFIPTWHFVSTIITMMDDTPSQISFQSKTLFTVVSVAQIPQHMAVTVAVSTRIYVSNILPF